MATTDQREGRHGEAGPRRPATVLDLDDVRFGYEAEATVLDGVSLAVERGSVTAVVGPSGCGKTTLLSILAGFLKPGSGRVTWSGGAGEAGRHPLTMMFQKDTLLPWLTLEDNIGLHFKLARTGLSKAARRQRIGDLIQLAGLAGHERRYPYQLSGGMRRRTAFLTAVAPQPQVLLLDEPFSSLDEPTRVLLHQDIFKIVKRYDIGVVLVTHDLAEAVSLSDEVVILSSRPARVVDRHAIPFGDDRDILGLRENPSFLRLYGTLWQQLEQQIRASQHAGPG